MIETVNPFPPLIFKSKFKFTESHLLSAKEILSGTSDQGKNFLEAGNASSSVANQFNAPHQHSVFADFFQWQNSVANEIILNHYKLSGSVEYIVGNSWVNVHKDGGKTLAHNHGLSALSAVAYIKLPTNSGYTEFKDPFYDLRSLHERSDGDTGLSEWASMPVEEGDVLFFPGWLQHRSQESKSLEERWILSSNYINFKFLELRTLGSVLF